MTRDHVPDCFSGTRVFQKYLIFKWSERRDLNPRPLVPQTSALTGLRHAPTGRAYKEAGAMAQQTPPRIQSALIVLLNQCRIEQATAFAELEQRRLQLSQFIARQFAVAFVSGAGRGLIERRLVPLRDVAAGQRL